MNISQIYFSRSYKSFDLKLKSSDMDAFTARTELKAERMNHFDGERSVSACERALSTWLRPTNGKNPSE